MKQLLTKFFVQKSANYNNVLVDGGKLTEKGQKVVATYLALGKAQNNDAIITVPQGNRSFAVTEYSVITGNMYDLLNFSTEVSMTKEGQAANKWAVSEKDVTVDETKLVSPTMLNDIINEWSQIQAGLAITVKPISKERKLISDFKYLYKDADNFYIVGAPTGGGINENIIFFREVTFNVTGIESLYVHVNHYTVRDERESWILASSN